MVTPEQLRLTARYSPDNAVILRNAADRIESLTAASQVSPELIQAHQILKGRLPRVSGRHTAGQGYYYTSRLGYLCYKPNNHPRSVGHAICTVNQFKVYSAFQRAFS